MTSELPVTPSSSATTVDCALTCVFPRRSRRVRRRFHWTAPWGLYKRMLDTLPNGMLQLDQRATEIQDLGNEVQVKFANGRTATADVVVGADGINSFVRAALWGEQPIRHQRLHLVGGYLFTDGPRPTEGVVAHNKTTQASYTPIRHEGKSGYEWWVLEACDPDKPMTEDYLDFALPRSEGFTEKLRQLISVCPI